MGTITQRGGKIMNDIEEQIINTLRRDIKALQEKTEKLENEVEELKKQIK